MRHGRAVVSVFPLSVRARRVGSRPPSLSPWRCDRRTASMTAMLSPSRTIPSLRAGDSASREAVLRQARRLNSTLEGDLGRWLDCAEFQDRDILLFDDDVRIDGDLTLSN